MTTVTLPLLSATADKTAGALKMPFVELLMKSPAQWPPGPE